MVICRTNGEPGVSSEELQRKVKEIAALQEEVETQKQRAAASSDELANKTQEMRALREEVEAQKEKNNVRTSD